MEDFAKDRTRPSGRKSLCKSCHKTKMAEWRAKNPDKLREIQERSRSKTKSRSVGLSYVEKRERLDAIKRERRCFFCFEDTPVCLDFHHRDETTKAFTISKHFHRPYAELLDEISKCEILCANCHRKLHAGLLSFS